MSAQEPLSRVAIGNIISRAVSRLPVPSGRIEIMSTYPDRLSQPFPLIRWRVEKSIEIFPELPDNVALWVRDCKMLLDALDTANQERDIAIAALAAARGH